MSAEDRCCPAAPNLARRLWAAQDDGRAGLLICASEDIRKDRAANANAVQTPSRLT